jgi:flagella basal body P-ring formation protein FlgA
MKNEMPCASDKALFILHFAFFISSSVSSVSSVVKHSPPNRQSTMTMSELRTNLSYWLLAIIFVLASWTAPVRGAEIHLRTQAAVSGRVVTLGDVADIHAGEEERAALAGTELIPTPAISGKSLKLREVQDLLALRGVATGKHRFGGASEVRLVDAATSTSKQERKDRAAGSAARGANTAVETAIAKYLARNVDADRDWRVKVELTEDQVRVAQNAFGRITVEGGTEPWEGPQQFTIFVGAKETHFTVEAQLELPEMIVVAARPLVKGDVIRASDLTLEPAKRGVAQKGAFRSPDEIIGQEAVRAIVAGQVLDNNYVQPPVLVKRGDVVTVYAYSSGIRVKTTGRSRQAGAKGELVEIESHVDRKRFFARVSDIQIVEVFASAAQSTDAAAAQGSLAAER